MAAERRLDRYAEHIAKDPFKVKAMVDGKLACVAVQANAAMFRAQDQATQSLIDTYA